jgi:Tol biopolymer transport system component
MTDNKRQTFNLLKIHGNGLMISLGFAVILMIFGVFLLFRYLTACRELGYFDLSWSPGTLIAYKRANYFCTFPLCSNALEINTIDKKGYEITVKSELHGAIHFTWSPDGQRIAFTAGYAFEVGQSSGCSLAVFDTNDGSLGCLFQNGPTIAPAWSPDGSRIAFWSSNSAMNIMDLKSKTITKVPNITGTVYDSLSWSQDSSSIAFVSDRDGNYEIYKVKVNGDYLINNLTNNPSDEWSPEWSPDGNRIAFVSRRGGFMGGPTPEAICGILSGCGYPKTYTMKSDGTDVKLLIDAPAADQYAKWSPDGKKIVLVSERDGNPEVYVVNPDGTGLFRLTDNKFEDSSPVWSPDGTQIAFTSKRNGYLNINIVGTDGTNEIQLTQNSSNSPCFLLP